MPKQGAYAQFLQSNVMLAGCARAFGSQITAFGREIHLMMQKCYSSGLFLTPSKSIINKWVLIIFNIIFFLKKCRKKNYVVNKCRNFYIRSFKNLYQKTFFEISFQILFKTYSTTQ